MSNIKKIKNFSFTIPIDRDRNNKYFKTASSAKEDALTDLKLLLFTGKKERMMQPDYGCDLRSLIFENDIEYIKTTILQRLSEQLPKLKNVEVQNINVLSFYDLQPNERGNLTNENSIIIQLMWKLKNVDTELEKLELELEL